VYDEDDFPEQHYERTGSPAMAYAVLAALVAVVGVIAALAVWTSA
jgi:hypothetical protein